MGRIAFLGLGAMGSRMAKHVLQAGRDVVVYNRTPERAAELQELGAQVAETPRQAAEGAEIVISIVRDIQASREIWLSDNTGAVHGLGSESIAIESSTVTPEWARELSTALTKSGAEFLDAPVVGSRPQADAAQLIWLAGGNSETVENVRSTLLLMGSAVHHTGQIGTGNSMKLAVNSLLGIQIAAFAEVITALVKQGFDQAAVIEVLQATPVTSPVAQRITGLMATKNFAPNFPVNLVAKDLGYATETTTQAGGIAPLSKAARDMYNAACEQGFGEDDISGIIQAFQ